MLIVAVYEILFCAINIFWDNNCFISALSLLGWGDPKVVVICVGHMTTWCQLWGSSK